jgi:hypothetical protein
VVYGQLGVGIAPVLLAAFFLWFFRDPERPFQAGEGLIVSPGDGLVTETVTIATPDGPAAADQHLPQRFRCPCEPLARSAACSAACAIRRANI